MPASGLANQVGPGPSRCLAQAQLPLRSGDGVGDVVPELGVGDLSKSRQAASETSSVWSSPMSAA